MSKKKLKPRNRPVSAKEKQQAVAETADKVIFDEWTILFTIMRDKWGWGGKRLWRIWDMCEDICNGIKDEKIDFEEILSNMRKITGIKFENWKKPENVNIRNALQLKRALNARRRAAEDFFWCIFLYILHKSEGFGAIRLKRIHTSRMMIHEAIKQGYVTVNDLRQALKDEGNIEISEG